MRRLLGRALGHWWAWATAPPLLFLLFHGLLFEAWTSGLPLPVKVSSLADNHSAKIPIILTNSRGWRWTLNSGGAGVPELSSLRLTVQSSLFLISGLCGLMVFCFLARSLHLELADSDTYDQVSGLDLPETSSTTSDEETAF